MFFIIYITIIHFEDYSVLSELEKDFLMVLYTYEGMQGGYVMYGGYRLFGKKRRFNYPFYPP